MIKKKEEGEVCLVVYSLCYVVFTSNSKYMYVHVYAGAQGLLAECTGVTNFYFHLLCMSHVICC